MKKETKILIASIITGIVAFVLLKFVKLSAIKNLFSKFKGKEER